MKSLVNRFEAIVRDHERLRRKTDEQSTKILGLQEELAKLKDHKYPVEPIAKVADKIWAACPYSDKKIFNIKTLKDQTGISLKEAKEAIEAAMDRAQHKSY
jgi:hypothetical protein